METPKASLRTSSSSPETANGAHTATRGVPDHRTRPPLPQKSEVAIQNSNHDSNAALITRQAKYLLMLISANRMVLRPRRPFFDYCGLVSQHVDI